MIKALPEKELKEVRSAFKAKGPRGARAILQKMKPINNKLMELQKIGSKVIPVLKKHVKKHIKPRETFVPFTSDTEGYKVVGTAEETEK
jgi:hypothetical protein